MDKIHRIITAFLNTAEGYFHIQTVLQDMVKQPRGQFGEMDNRPERWNYKDKRDITAKDYESILANATKIVDAELFKMIPDVALKAALDFTIHDFNKWAYQSKIEAPMYKMLLDALRSKFSKER